MSRVAHGWRIKGQLGNSPYISLMERVAKTGFYAPPGTSMRHPYLSKPFEATGGPA
jgi:hypothetical protein